MTAALRSFFRNPVYVVACIGLIGFLTDMFLKPISNAGLILIALASSPWLTRLIKSAKVAGVELELAQPAPPASTGARLAEEVSATAILSPPSQSADQNSRLPQAVPGSAGSMFSQNQPLAMAYLAEGLVLQDLHREIGGVLQRDVQLAGGKGREVVVDGLILLPDETVAVEVKLAFGKPMRAIIDDLVERYSQIPSRLRYSGYPQPSLVIAVVTDESPRSWARFLKDRAAGEADLLRHRPHIKLRHFNFSDLLTKYGFAEKKAGPSGLDS